MFKSLFSRKERTPDQELANNIRKAADAYNEAVKEAKKAGLIVRNYMSYGNYTDDYVSDKKFSDISVQRTTVEKL